MGSVKILHPRSVASLWHFKTKEDFLSLGRRKGNFYPTAFEAVKTVSRMGKIQSQMQRKKDKDECLFTERFCLDTQRKAEIRQKVLITRDA